MSNCVKLAEGSFHLNKGEAVVSADRTENWPASAPTDTTDI